MHSLAFSLVYKFFKMGIYFQNDAKSCANPKLMHLIKYSALRIIKFQSFSKARLCATNFLLERLFSVFHHMLVKLVLQCFISSKKLQLDSKEVKKSFKSLKAQNLKARNLNFFKNQHQSKQT